MIHRVCDCCGKSWYSADDSFWYCESCGQILDEANDAPLERPKEKEGLHE